MTPDLNLQWEPVEILPGMPPVLTAIRPEEIQALCKLCFDPVKILSEDVTTVCNAGRNVLEIGSAHGYSAIEMALAGAKSVTSIDDHNGGTQLGNTFQIMHDNLQIFGVSDRVTMYTGDSTKIMLDLIEDDRTFDLVFVDGAGDYKKLILDIGLGLALIRRPGIIAVHDYGHTLYPDKKKACDKMFPDGPDKLVTTLFIKYV